MRGLLPGPVETLSGAGGGSKRVAGRRLGGRLRQARACNVGDFTREIADKYL
jgi:hypothetical protein